MVGFGERLKEARGSESQASFANKLGISQVAYSRYESGQREPGLDCLYQIGVMTGVSVDWLLGLDRQSANALQVNGSGNAVATGPGSRATVQASASPADCRTCPYRRKLAKLEKLISGK